VVARVAWQPPLDLGCGGNDCNVRGSKEELQTMAMMMAHSTALSSSE
jgi:hypothetical protein